MQSVLVEIWYVFVSVFIHSRMKESPPLPKSEGKRPVPDPGQHAGNTLN